MKKNTIFLKYRNKTIGFIISPNKQKPKPTTITTKTVPATTNQLGIHFTEKESLGENYKGAASVSFVLL